MLVMWILAGVAAAAVAACLLARPLRSVLRERTLRQARARFHREREWLEARFFTAASSTGKPRGLRWVECDFEDGVTYARDRRSGLLTALTGVTIAFEAIPGGPMEHVEAVGNLRSATAVFHFCAGAWGTEGRVLFNLNPAEAVNYYREELEPVESR